MGFAFTHILAAWIPAKVYEAFGNKISKYAWPALLFGSILPDADLLIQWPTGLPIHRTITHSLVFLILAGLFMYFLWKLLGFGSPKKVGIAMSLGIAIHLLTDIITYPGVQIFWPFNVWVYWWGFHMPTMRLYEVYASIYYAIFDMGLGIAWIAFLWLRGKVRF